jgi:hypothetical protein
MSRDALDELLDECPRDALTPVPDVLLQSRKRFDGH